MKIIKQYKRKADGVNRDLLQDLHAIADANLTNFKDAAEFRVWAQGLAREAIARAQREQA